MYPTTHYPKYEKKYTGGIEKKAGKTKTSYQLVIKSQDICYDKTFSSFEEAFEMMKAKNIEHNLPIKNMITEYDDYMTVELTRGKQCKFDKADRELVESHTWGCNSSGYAWTRVGDKRKYLHSLMLNHEAGPEDTIDHINRDRLDNRRANLRQAS